MLVEFQIPISIIITIIIVWFGFRPYLVDLFKGTTKPHAYTWVIWALTQGVATAGLWYGGAGIAAIPITIGTSLVVFTALLSFWYGTEDITKTDTTLFVGALFAVAMWIVLKNPVFSVLLATAIDAVGYIPTFRKTYADPRSETPSAYGGFTIAAILNILILDTYSLLTLSYLSMYIVVTGALVALILWRRKQTEL